MQEETAIKGRLGANQNIENVVLLSFKIYSAIWLLKNIKIKQTKIPIKNANNIEILKIIFGSFLFCFAIFSEIMQETAKLIPDVENVTTKRYKDIIS